MSTALDLLAARRDQLEADLGKQEKTIYDVETQYLSAEYCQTGSVLKGFEGFLSSKDTLRKRARAFKAEDRAFSLSSRTSPATFELEQSAAELASDGNTSFLGRGKGTYSQKGVAVKGRR
ncbi:hypothetical protein WJX72_003528 [[Myrmecia] bisecta]|uniref:Chromatin modification-related protein MEAF6 n=1 Tax=[Myrmecia] bisecta TaxID=41462 RepID=A0AAW1PG31_9CHLO